VGWQWVAGAYSAKPYQSNADNVARYAPAHWHSPSSVLDQSYEALERMAGDARGAPASADVKQDRLYYAWLGPEQAAAASSDGDTIVVPVTAIGNGAKARLRGEFAAQRPRSRFRPIGLAGCVVRPSWPGTVRAGSPDYARRWPGL